MASRRRHGAPREPSPARAVAGWGAFSVVVGCVVTAVVEPSAWMRILWLAPVGALLVVAATVTVWAMPQRPMPPEEPRTASDDLP